MRCPPNIEFVQGLLRPGALYVPRQYEASTKGVDENLQLVGADPNRSLSGVGLRVPFLPTPTFAAGGAALRYLFLCSAIEVPAGGYLRIKGLRQLVKLGAMSIAATVDEVAHRPVEQEIFDSQWHPPDADISWHLRRIGRNELPRRQAGSLDSANFQFRNATSSALLYDTGTTVPAAHIDPLTGRPDFYVFLDNYVPPFGGRPPGTPAHPDLGTFYDLRFPWRAASLNGMDVIVDGGDSGCVVGAYASVRQTNASTRDVLPNGPFTAANIGGTAGYLGAGLSPEEQFLKNFPTAVYWRVAFDIVAEDIPGEDM